MTCIDSLGGVIINEILTIEKTETKCTLIFLQLDLAKASLNHSCRLFSIFPDICIPILLGCFSFIKESLRRPSYSVLLVSMCSFLQLSLNSSIPLISLSLVSQNSNSKTLFFYEKAKSKTRHMHIHTLKCKLTYVIS